MRFPRRIKSTLKPAYRILSTLRPAYGTGAFTHRFSPADDVQEFFVNGYLKKSFEPGATLERLNTIVAALRAGEIKSGFKWEQKYEGTADFRPAAYMYDGVFTEILFDSGVPELLKRVTGLDLFLAHIQLRNAFPGESYMDWHRDTHIYGDVLSGNIPPVHKVIFYPTVGAEPRPQLFVAAGSHRRIFHSRFSDLRQLSKCKRETIDSSDTEYLLFDTSMLHSVVPQNDTAGSLRIIYSFCSETQLDGYKEQQDLHKEYRSRLVAS